MTPHSTSQEQYVIYAWLDNAQEKDIQIGSLLKVSLANNQPIEAEILDLKAQPSGEIGKTQAYFYKQFQAVLMPLQNAVAREQFAVVAAISTVLAATGLSLFFNQGWRLEICRRMAKGAATVAPVLDNLEDIGKYLANGLVLVLVKSLYDFPKILVVVVLGYANISFLLDFLKWVFLEWGQTPFGDFLRTKPLNNYTYSLIAQLILWAAYSFLVTPTFKIIAFKYALGNISFAGFFNPRELSQALRTYRMFPRATLQAYLWSQAVGVGSRLLGVTVLVWVPLLGLFLLPAYLLLFSHWPKAYGYGTLARRLYVNRRLEKYPIPSVN